MALSSLRVVDDDMNDVAVGEVGEIVVQGDQVMRATGATRTATEEAFAGGWFHTGDLGRFDDEGFHYIVDRKKDMIITGGENVYSREVEDVHLPAPGGGGGGGHRPPRRALGRERVRRRRAGGRARRSPQTRSSQLCRDNLAGYKKPKRVEFVDDLPRNASGKVLKRELRAQLS